ncbi:DUF5794 domain-containing protein [Halorussus sp. MSC15.2]|uniref:DUF5794 domain-containing protein n=1 Tax=Halorussus sp. MSC15.2 TaxID=2283638 RepID=UPI0013D45852|nr:DUF5794 domain-containing protein [Halorussus sp. MSC15.2]NEU57129.1 hypothetical protein [Halorussus sp. MSC15.2]
MSSSQHPVALRLERHVGGATKLLATVMGLPLVDGIFPALVLAGGVDTITGVLQVGLLVFGGSATVAVILAEMDGTPREQAKTVFAVGVVIVAVAAVEAAFAPTIKSVLDPKTFERFAALVMLAIAAKTASSRIGEYLPRPAVIVGLGMIASFQPGQFQIATVDYWLILKATAAAATGVTFALTVALTSPWLRDVVDIDRFRFGSAVALGILPLSLLGLAPGNAPLAVLVVTSLLAFDPGSTEDETDDAIEETAATEAMNEETTSPVNTSPSNPVGSQAVATDGAGSSDSDDAGYSYPSSEDGDEREPWL